ncbi:hypothetical protein QZH41_006350 [Actinostola sp. cb2023]|nr:hypothetical protein QZH41_006350 [Actinostola sp. cb2023]
MQDVLRTLKQEYPEIKKVHFRQDNAGCYHASTTILACSDIAQSTGVEIARLDFSDPQGGKGAADRLAATCKAHIRRFINEGNDVTTANQLEAALLSHGSIEGIRVVSMESIQDVVIGEYKQKIPNIKTLRELLGKPKENRYVALLNDLVYTLCDIIRESRCIQRTHIVREQRSDWKLTQNGNHTKYGKSNAERQPYQNMECLEYISVNIPRMS